MGAFRVLLGSLHYMGLYMQLSVSTRQAGHGEIENHISGNAMFTEVPHDMTAQRGQDVEMACSFRGAGTPSYSLEIQWWYIRNHLDWTDRQPWTTNEVAPEEEMPKDATKISINAEFQRITTHPLEMTFMARLDSLQPQLTSVFQKKGGVTGQKLAKHLQILQEVVKVVGSNISHKLRLSRVKPSDEGIYECRVIDFSDDAGARHHRVRAYLQVVPESDIVSSNRNDNFEALDDTKGGVEFVDGDDVESHDGTKEHPHGHRQSHGHHQEHGKRPPSSAHHGHSHSHSGSSQQHKAGRELRKRDVDSNHSHNDCTNEPSCTL